MSRCVWSAALRRYKRGGPHFFSVVHKGHHTRLGGDRGSHRGAPPQAKESIELETCPPSLSLSFSFFIHRSDSLRHVEHRLVLCACTASCPASLPQSPHLSSSPHNEKNSSLGPLPLPLLLLPRLLLLPLAFACGGLIGGEKAAYQGTRVHRGVERGGRIADRQTQRRRTVRHKAQGCEDKAEKAWRDGPRREKERRVGKGEVPWAHSDPSDGLSCRT